jgi:hypothetical protein
MSAPTAEGTHRRSMAWLGRLRARAAARRPASWWPTSRDGRVALVGLALILVAGAIMRVLFLAAWRPSFFGFPDTVSYVGLALEKLWVDPTREVGYPLFLRELHALFPTHLTWAIALQHVFGLVSAVLLFLAVRRAGGPLSLGLLPAAVVALNGAEMFLEHSTLTESLFIFLQALGIYLAVRAAGARLPIWAALAGLAFGLANTVRVVALPSIVIVLAWLLLLSGGTWRRRLLATVCALVCTLAVLVPYAVVQHKHTGYWGVTTPAGAWNLYARVAPFANCHKFTPPPGTKVLCEGTPPSQRTLSVEGYDFDPASPAYIAFGKGAGPFWSSQASNRKIAAWTRAVILHQPLDYLATIFEGLLAYVTPTHLLFGNRVTVGAGYQAFYHEILFEPQEMEVARQERLDLYGANGYKINPSLNSFLLEYETVMRPDGVLMAVLMLLTFFAPFLPRGRSRQLGLLLFLLAWTSLVTPVASHQWDARVAIPPLGPVSAAAALGLWQLVRIVSKLRRSRLPGVGRPRKSGGPEQSASNSA